MKYKVPIEFQEITTPSNPVSGYRKVYSKNDGIYMLDSLGIEIKLGVTTLTLAQVLTENPATGGNNIVFTTGDKIITQSSNFSIDFGMFGNAIYMLDNANTDLFVGQGQFIFNYDNTLIDTLSLGATGYLIKHSSSIALDTPSLKITQQTASRVPVIDSSKHLISSTTTLTELGYVSGVTSSIQTQLNNMNFTTVLTNGNTTANGQVIKALNGGGQLDLRANNTNDNVLLNNTGSTEFLSLVPGEARLSSQTQATLYSDLLVYLNAPTIYLDSPLYNFAQLSASTALYLDSSKYLRSSSVTPTELGYVSGVTSAIQTQINSKIDKNITINSQPDNYTLVLTDVTKLIEMTKVTANNLTIPLNASVAFPIGTQILIYQLGVGQVTIVPTGGVTLISSGGKTKTSVQYSTACLIKTATDTWLLGGDITT